MELARFFPHITGDDERKAMKFQRGLWTGIRNRLTALRLRSFADIVEISMTVEHECEEVPSVSDQTKKRPI